MRGERWNGTKIDDATVSLFHYFAHRIYITHTHTLTMLLLKSNKCAARERRMG